MGSPLEAKCSLPIGVFPITALDLIAPSAIAVPILKLPYSLALPGHPRHQSR